VDLAVYQVASVDRKSVEMEPVTDAGLKIQTQKTQGSPTAALIPQISGALETRHICLVAPPFNSSRRPSIQLGLLAELARNAGWECSTHHIFLDFAVMIGEDLFERIANNRGTASGDWLFAKEAFGDATPDPQGHDFLSALKPGRAQELLKARETIVPEFVTLAAAEILRQNPSVIGFTSTFQQTVAGIAIARRIKQLRPDVITVFGGANFEREMAMEWVQTIPSIDYALSGEADRTLGSFLAMLEGKVEAENVRGLTWKTQGKAVQSKPAGLVTDLDDNPHPDYREFFDRARYLGILDNALRNTIRIPFESARGCWWGETQHCTFCGLNALSMKFRSKSSTRVLEELFYLSDRHQSFHFEAVDNIIDVKYSKTLLPELKKPNQTFDIFYEVKSNLKPDDLRNLSEAGIKTIQPGIESLSTPVLKLMKKGVRGLHNVNLLRWAKVYGVSVSWNVLWGFPGEEQHMYDSQAELFKKLHHLQPPSAGVRIWLERFSPLFKDKEMFPREWCKPEASLTYIIPDYIDKEKIAYFFDYSLENSLPDDAFGSLESAIENWQAAWQTLDDLPSLVYFAAGNSVVIEDRRTPGQGHATKFRGNEANVFLKIVETPLSIARVAQDLDQSIEEVERTLRQLEARGFVAIESDLCLALPLPFRR
jgi:ribosomal peptide maturation radical SAM protein 1